jgi:Centriolar protein SAS N-terminal
MSRELFRGRVPVEVTDRSDAGTSASVRRLPLDVALTALPAVSLSLSASDLDDRLFIASCELTAVDYPALRTACDLKRDFPGFQQLVADLLRRAAAPESGFAAKLELSPPGGAGSGDAAAGTAVFSVVQDGDYLDFQHLRLELALAPDAVLRRALSDRAKAAAADADRRVAAAEEARTTAEKRAAEAEAARAAAAELAEETRASAGRRADAAEAASERKDEEVAAAEARVREVEAELDSAVRERDRLAVVVREAHQSMRVADVVMQRQEEEVRRVERREERSEQRRAAAEVELRKEQNRREMLELELDGMRGRLEVAMKKIEEADSVRAMDQKVITYLNRELNERDIARQRISGASAIPRTRRPSYVYSDDADDESILCGRGGDSRSSSSSGAGAAGGSVAAAIATTGMETTAATGGYKGDVMRDPGAGPSSSAYALARRRGPSVSTPTNL